LLPFVDVLVASQRLDWVVGDLDFIWPFLGESLTKEWSSSDLFGRIPSLSLVVQVIVELFLSSCGLSLGIVNIGVELEARV
jgi:hypothetical protein